jgi:hypothetical protein
VVVPAAKGPGFGEQAQAAGRAALEALKLYLGSPVGDIGKAHETLGTKRAFTAGLVFAAVAVLAMIVGLLLLFRGIGFTGFLRNVLRFVVMGLVCFGVLVAAILAARSALGAKGKGTIEGDVFVAGAALLPVGVWILLAGIFGPLNREIITITGVFAFCYTTFILYGGCTRVAGISERAATLIVPTILVVTVWLGEVIFRAVAY